MGANEPVAPASLLQVAGTGRIVREKSLALWQRLWEPKIATLVNVHEHGRTLPLVAVGDNRIGKDYAFLSRLEELEDRLSDGDSQTKRSRLKFDEAPSDMTIGIDAIQPLLQPNEALILHDVAPRARVTCRFRSIADSHSGASRTAFR